MEFLLIEIMNAVSDLYLYMFVCVPVYFLAVRSAEGISLYCVHISDYPQCPSVGESIAVLEPGFPVRFKPRAVTAGYKQQTDIRHNMRDLPGHWLQLNT